MSRKRPRDDEPQLHQYLARWVQRRRLRQLQDRVLACARRVYAELGWGWSESTYREALAVELHQDGLAVQSEVSHAILYRGRPLSHVSLKMDMVVADQLVLELKAVPAASAGTESLAKAAQQCLRYLRTVDCLRAGMVLNFPDKAGRKLVHISLP